MTATLLDSDIFGFDDGNAGHVCEMGSAPSAGHVDVLCINSDTVVSVAGFTAAETAVTNQGAYIFVRVAAGGETDDFTVLTSGNHPCAVGWSRWSGIVALDTSTSTQINAAVGGSTPAHSTGALAEADELVIAFGALHSIGSGTPQSAPVWTPGTFTQLTDSTFQGIGSNGVRGYVGYKNGAGPTAETPQVSWTGDGVFDRYMLTVSFTTVAVGGDTGEASRFLSFF